MEIDFDSVYDHDEHGRVQPTHVFWGIVNCDGTFDLPVGAEPAQPVGEVDERNDCNNPRWCVGFERVDGSDDILYEETEEFVDRVK